MGLPVEVIESCGLAGRGTDRGDEARPAGTTGGPRIPGEPVRGPFCCGRGLTGRVERHVRGTTP